MNPDLVDDIDGEIDSDSPPLSGSFGAEGNGRWGPPVRVGDTREPDGCTDAVGSRRSIGLVLAVIVIWTGVSLGGALPNPALGSSFASRFAEWAREHGGASIVNWVENEWYSHHPPPSGRQAPGRGDPRPAHVAGPRGDRARPSAAARADRDPCASPAIAGEGQWSPAGRLVGGLPAIYETTLRPDAVHTSYVVGVAWMDTKLLKATLYSGSQIPGGGPYTHTAPMQPGAADSLVAAFNAGFLMADANGGYYTDGKAILPLRSGAASFVVYRNGSATVGQWGRDVTMTPERRVGPPEPRPPGRRGQAGPRARTPRTRRSGVTPWAIRSTSGARASGSPPTVPSSTWAARGSTSPTWPICLSGPGRCGPWSSTSTPTG